MAIPNKIYPVLEDFACGILAGGRGMRMGQDKAFLDIDGKPLIKRSIEKLSQLFSHIMISTDKPDKVNDIGTKTFKDVFDINCPLNGIYSILLKSPKQYNFIIACDMPYINLELIKFLASKIDGQDAVVPESSNGIEPLYAIYSKSCLDIIRKSIKSRRLKATGFYSLCKVKIVKINEDEWSISGGSPFTNINHYDDYITLLKNIKGAVLI